MISDPGHPDYRYPVAGERYHHEHWYAQCHVIEPWPELEGLYSPTDEVPVRFDNGDPAIVKLRSLVPLP